MASALKGHHDIALGNIFGSNLFNLMAVMPAAGAIAPLELSGSAFYRDYVAMATLSALLYTAVRVARRRNRPGGHFIARRTGAVLLALYATYYGVLLATG